MLVSASSVNPFSAAQSPYALTLASGAVKKSDLAESSLKPVDQSASSAKSELRSQQQHVGKAEDEKATNDTAGSDEDARAQAQREKYQQQQERLEIQDLAARDREVRAHEQAHVAAGGQYAGAPSYQYERGPDGVSYAVAGEVPISTGREATPEATLRKAQIVRRAALAPAEPSPQDRKVAAMATQMEAEARRDITLARRLEAEAARESQAPEDESSEAEESSAEESTSARSGLSSSENLHSAPRLPAYYGIATRIETIHSSSVGGRINQYA